MKLNSMEDIRIATRLAGNHWFDRETLRFFNSRVSSITHPASDGSRYFVTSERMDGTRPRLYSVRRAFYGADGGFRIETVGEFQEFKTSKAAHRSAKLYARGPFTD